MRWCIWSGLSWNRADDEIINSWAQVNMAEKWEIKTLREPINHNYLGGYFESSVLINRKRVIALISVVINSKNACIQPSVKSEHLVNLKFKQLFFPPLHFGRAWRTVSKLWGFINGSIQSSSFNTFPSSVPHFSFGLANWWQGSENWLQHCRSVFQHFFNFASAHHREC